MRHSRYGRTHVRILVELIGGDEIDREHKLDVALLRFLDQSSNLLGTGLVKQRVADLIPPSVTRIYAQAALPRRHTPRVAIRDAQCFTEA